MTKFKSSYQTIFIGMTININGTIIYDFTIMLGGIIWRDMTVSGGDFWYSCAWNPVIAVILDIKPFLTSLSSSWDIIFSGNCINSYFHSHEWNLNLGGNAIIIGLGSVEFCYICLGDISIHVLSIVDYIRVSNFPPLAVNPIIGLQPVLHPSYKSRFSWAP